MVDQRLIGILLREIGGLVFLETPFHKQAGGKTHSMGSECLPSPPGRKNSLRCRKFSNGTFAGYGNMLNDQVGSYLMMVGDTMEQVLNQKLADDNWVLSTTPTVRKFVAMLRESAYVSARALGFFIGHPTEPFMRALGPDQGFVGSIRNGPSPSSLAAATRPSSP